jgi:hypothetical protein
MDETREAILREQIAQLQVQCDELLRAMREIAANAAVYSRGQIHTVATDAIRIATIPIVTPKV